MIHTHLCYTQFLPRCRSRSSLRVFPSCIRYIKACGNFRGNSRQNNRIQPYTSTTRHGSFLFGSSCGEHLSCSFSLAMNTHRLPATRVGNIEILTKADRPLRLHETSAALLADNMSSSVGRGYGKAWRKVHASGSDKRDPFRSHLRVTARIIAQTARARSNHLKLAPPHVAVSPAKSSA